MTSQKFKNKKNSAGFSLIELMVTLSIIIIISSITLVNYPDLSEQHSINRAARTVSLSLRDAQIRSMAVKESPDALSANPFPAYGVHFSKSTKKQFFIFADNNCFFNTKPDCKYDLGTDTVVDNKIIPTIAQIKKICGNLKSLGTCTELDEADIVFQRPTPSIFLKGTVSGVVSDYNDIEVLIDSPTGQKKFQKMIGVTLTGQVFLQEYNN